MQNVRAVHEKAAGGSDHREFDVRHRATLDVQRREGNMGAVLVRDDAGRAILRRHIGEVDEGGHLLVSIVDSGDDQAVTSEVSMERLVVIDSSGIFRP